MLITGAQVHLWEADRADRPWPGTSRRSPSRSTFSARKTENGYWERAGEGAEFRPNSLMIPDVAP